MILDDQWQLAPSTPVDVGTADFTIEWWLRRLSYGLSYASLTIACGNRIGSWGIVRPVLSPSTG
jgi:hypothetical protein